MKAVPRLGVFWLTVWTESPSILCCKFYYIKDQRLQIVCPSCQHGYQLIKHFAGQCKISAKKYPIYRGEGGDNVTICEISSMENGMISVLLVS